MMQLTDVEPVLFLCRRQWKGALASMVAAQQQSTSSVSELADELEDDLEDSDSEDEPEILEPPRPGEATYGFRAAMSTSASHVFGAHI